MRSVALLAIGLLALASCAPDPSPANLHQGMAQIVAPSAQVLWDVSNRGTNDEGEPDGRKLKTADWQALAAAAQALRDEAASLASAKAIEAAAPGEKILNEGQSGASSAAQVQQYIDQDRAGFSAESGRLRDVADAMFKASAARDAGKLLNAAGELDAICEACHVKYWYPQEAAAQANAAR